MKINIVWVTPGGDRIIDRLARVLADGTGWPLSEGPDPKADINLSMLYVDMVQRFSDWRLTKWAAYFSHLEANSPHKVYWWEQAAHQASVKIITAPMYAAALSPRIVRVIPPVDPQFVILENIARRKTTQVGVSGFVVPGGRKGEAMVARLAGDLEGRAEVVASGQGWPCRRVNSEIIGLPSFYNSLDVFVCTSLIEGIPMPPLEALACGVQVVIPTGVGLLDELADVPGVWRYPAGDYGKLLGSVKAALEYHANREVLRSVVSSYTPEAWAKSVSDGLSKPSPAQVKSDDTKMTSDLHGGRGVYYVAYGDPARHCAVEAIESFKRYLPAIPVALVSDRPLGPEDVFIAHPDEDIGGRLAKVKIYDLAPKEWQYVCYLDADTEIVATSDLLWKIVEDGWDLVICKNPSRFHIAREMKRSDNADECRETFDFIGCDEVFQLNGGVFAFQRNKRTEAFFNAWVTEWLRYAKRDQGALLRALWQHPLKLFILGNEWNTITRYDSPGRAAWLLHYPMKARRWRNIVDHPLNSPEAWDAVKKFTDGAA